MALNWDLSAHAYVPSQTNGTVIAVHQLNRCTIGQLREGRIYAPFAVTVILLKPVRRRKDPHNEKKRKLISDIYVVPILKIDKNDCKNVANYLPNFHQKIKDIRAKQIFKNYLFHFWVLSLLVLFVFCLHVSSAYFACNAFAPPLPCNIHRKRVEVEATFRPSQA